MAIKNNRDRRTRLVFGLSALSLFFFLLAKVVPSREARDVRIKMIAASQRMSEAETVLKECREAKGISIDLATDINQTGIIGVRTSPFTTTLGSLPAKRTSTNPNFAGLMVYLLTKAGVEKGDTVAVGASGSFPGLLLAVLSAAKTMELKPLVFISLGSSQWGANHPAFHLLDMQACLQKNGLLSFRPIGVSIGGDGDYGKDMTEEGRTLLEEDIRNAGFSLLSAAGLKANVASRMSLYFEEAAGHPIRAFVNIGGSWTNMGTDSSILSLRPGLGKIPRFPPEEKQGVIHAMADKGIPVIHLLFVHGLVQRYELAWDPVPLPRPGEGNLYREIEEKQRSFLVIAVVYLVLVGTFTGLGIKKPT